MTRRPAPAARPLAAALRLYRALANAFPYEFKNAYGAELVQLTEDAIEPVWRRHGLPGLARLLLDIAIRVPVEHLAELRQDVRYGLRMLAASPGFTAVALISLTLGIGVATSAFSELNGFVLRDVPGVHKPDELVTIRGPIAYPAYQRYRERSDLFSATLAYLAPVPFGVSMGGPAVRTWGHLVTASYFSTLGVRPAAGRFFAGDDEQPGRAPAAVISYRLWQNRLGSDPEVIGRTIRVNGQPCTVIGVGPRDFQGASPMVYGADLWLPAQAGAHIAPELAGNTLERHDRAVFQFVARLRPGAGETRAAAVLDVMARQMEQEYGDPDREQKAPRIALAPGGKLLPVPKRDLPLLTGFMAVLGGMILLIASSNVANMTLARAADRRKEIAIRLALGAGRARLIRQLLTESMLVAAAAGVLGFVMAVVLMRLASQMTMLYPMPLAIHLEPDGRVLLFALCLTVFTGLSFGLLPALQATRTDLTPALKEGGNVHVRRHRRLSARNMLVLSQMAGSLAQLLMTSFLVIGHRRIAGTDVGFDARNVYLVSLDPLREGYSGARSREFFGKLLDRLKARPSIAAASVADAVPMTIIGKPEAAFTAADEGQSKAIYSARRYAVDRSFFAATGIPIVLGRGFRREDEADESTAAVVSEKLARACWKGQDPLGRRIEFGGDPLPGFQLAGAYVPGRRRTRIPGTTRVVQVVGVAKDVRDGLIMSKADARPVIYLPLRPSDYGRSSLHGMTVVVRTAPGVDGIGAVRHEISALDGNMAPFRTRSMPDQIDELLSPVRGAMWTYACLGVFGMVLAAVGIAGVTAYTVSQRRREIGIRMAVGARRLDVLGLVMKEGAILIAAGTVAGLACAAGGMRVLSSVMSGIAATAGTTMFDPPLITGATVLLASIALVACYLPARKSMRIDPAVTLRQE